MLSTNLCFALLICLPLLAVAAQQTIYILKYLDYQYTMHTILAAVDFALCYCLILQPDTQVIHVGSWTPPFAITVMIDPLTKIMAGLFSFVSFSIVIFARHDSDLHDYHRFFYSGYWLLKLGALGAISTYDVFNLYVWSEVILLSAFILISSTHLKNTLRLYHYALFNIIGTLFMLLAVALIYGTVGSLNYGEIAGYFEASTSQSAYLFALLLLLGLAIKGAVFPFYFWLPSVYPKTSISATMMLSCLITKVLMLVLLRLVWLWKPLHAPFLQTAMIILASGTMFFGVMGAANQFCIRKILSFHIVSQIGYILFAAFIKAPLAISATILFIIHNVLVKTNLFMVAGVIQNHRKTTLLDELKHLLGKNLFLSITFLLAAFSLAGFPPFSGFWAKLYVLQAGILGGYYTATAIAVLVSLFTLYSMMKIWRFAFCEVNHDEDPEESHIKISTSETIALLLLTLLTLLIGLFPSVLMQQINLASSELLQQSRLLGIN